MAGDAPPSPRDEIVSRWFCALCLIFLSTAAGSGCAAGRSRVCAYTSPLPPVGVVFVADGAGDFQITSRELADVVAETGAPLLVETVPWSHGYGRVLADHVDYAHAREEGARLAARIAAYRCAGGQSDVYLLGYSAGATVALAAAEHLPPNGAARVVLLAPSVAADYDLRPALRGARDGIDVFTSARDWAYLGVGTGLWGTSDRRWTAAAGRVGFAPRVETPLDATLYDRLRLHPWDPQVAWTGHRGGHAGSHRPDFLRAYVLPLLQPGGCP